MNTNINQDIPPEPIGTTTSPAEIVLDGDHGDQLRVTHWSNGEDSFFRLDYYTEIGDYPDTEPVSSIEISPDAAMHLAMALAGTASRFIEATK